MDRGIQVDDHITLHMTVTIAAAIDIAALQTTVEVCILIKWLVGGDRSNILACLGTDGIPL